MSPDVGAHHPAGFGGWDVFESRRETPPTDLRLEERASFDVLHPVGASSVSRLDEVAATRLVLSEEIDQHRMLATAAPPAGDDQDPVHADP